MCAPACMSAHQVYAAAWGCRKRGTGDWPGQQRCVADSWGVSPSGDQSLVCCSFQTGSHVAQVSSSSLCGLCVPHAGIADIPHCTHLSLLTYFYLKFLLQADISSYNFSEAASPSSKDLQAVGSLPRPSRGSCFCVDIFLSQFHSLYKSLHLPVHLSVELTEGLLHAMQALSH